MKSAPLDFNNNVRDNQTENALEWDSTSFSFSLDFIVRRGMHPSPILKSAFPIMLRGAYALASLAIYMQIRTLSYFGIMKCLKVLRRVEMQQDN